MEQTPVLTVHDLETHLQIGSQIVTVVDKLSFTLQGGKTLALVGESGCGKSMTALSLMRILPTPPALLSTGQVIFKNVDLLKLPEKSMRKIRGARIAMIFQDPSTALNPVYTIGDQLLEVAHLHLGFYGDEAIQRCVTALAEVGIPFPREHLSDYPHQMSGGMRQRVMIAMALMCEPDILIADEPTTALDVTIQAQVLDLMRRLQKEKSMALLLITHDMGIVAEMADDVIVMYAAQAVERGKVLDVFDKMAHPYTQGLFASRPALQSFKGKLTPVKGSVPSVLDYPQGCRFHPRCPFVMERCRSGVVPDFSLTNEHIVKCWLYDGSQESEHKLGNEA